MEINEIVPLIPQLPVGAGIEGRQTVNDKNTCTSCHIEVTREEGWSRKPDDPMFGIGKRFVARANLTFSGPPEEVEEFVKKVRGIMGDGDNKG